ncbi:MAG: hypothetical protein V4574_17725 [Pseudomonadota bacterium]
MHKIAALLLLAAPLSGCAHYHIMVAEPERGTQPQSHGSMSAGWGAVREDVIAKNCVSNALAEVRVSRNFGQGLAAIVTFGAWQPATITWFCAKIPAPDSELNLGSGN